MKNDDQMDNWQINQNSLRLQKANSSSYALIVPLQCTETILIETENEWGWLNERRSKKMGYILNENKY